MHDIDWYIDRARENARIASDGKLSLALGLARVAVSPWRQRRTWPEEKHMVELAELAGVDPAQALLDLARWRSKDQKTAAVWQRIASRVAMLALPFFVTVAPADHAHSAVRAEARISEDCILWKVIRRLRGWFLSYENPACAHA